MSEPGFDEHLDLAVKAGALTKEDYVYYRDTNDEDDKDWQRIHKVRKGWKPVNYGSMYGIGSPKLSRELGVKQREAQKMIDAYWQRNWAVKELVKDLRVRKIRGQMWLLNPVNKFWYSLRFDKDRFSTLNQGTGSYCFDMYMAASRAYGMKMCMQWHDEGEFHVKDQEVTTDTLNKAIAWVNRKVKLNVPLGIDIKYGENYAEVH